FCFCDVSAATWTFTLSLHDALPICGHGRDRLVFGDVLAHGVKNLRPLQGSLWDIALGLAKTLHRNRAGDAQWAALHSYASTWHSDRKSTRLNSSHRTISYAVFCLKK